MIKFWSAWRRSKKKCQKPAGKNGLRKPISSESIFQHKASMLLLIYMWTGPKEKEICSVTFHMELAAQK